MVNPINLAKAGARATSNLVKTAGQTVCQNAKNLSPRTKSIAKISAIFTGGAATGVVGTELVHKFHKKA